MCCGSAGYLVASIDPSARPNNEGFPVFAKGALQAGNDLDVRNISSLAAAETWCKGNSSCSGFTTRITPDKNTGYKVSPVPVRVLALHLLVLCYADTNPARWR